MRGGRGFGEQGEVVADGAPGEALEGAVGQAFGEGIDGHEASDVGAVFERVAFGVVEAFPEGESNWRCRPRWRTVPETAMRRPGWSCLVEVGLVPPPAFDGAGAVGEAGFGGDAALRMRTSLLDSTRPTMVAGLSKSRSAMRLTLRKSSCRMGRCQSRS